MKNAGRKCRSNHCWLAATAEAARAQPMHKITISANARLLNFRAMMFSESRKSQGIASGLDRILAPVHRWIWGDTDRRVQKLLRFGETEIDGGRDLLRAAEVTQDPLL